MEITTAGYAVGNLWPMAEGPKWRGRKRAHRRRHFLREHREAKRLTQEKVAEEFGTTKATISRIETGDLPYNQDFLELYADYLGVHPAALLSQPPAQQPAPIAPPTTPARRRSRR